MDKVQQLFFQGPGHLVWKEKPSPVLEKAEDVLVRPIAVALCDVDVLALRGQYPVQAPYEFGHEFVSEIVEVGEKVTQFTKGDIVVAPVQISCGYCDRCHQEQTAWCRTVPQPAAFGLGLPGGHWPGAFCDLVRVPFADHMLVRVPNGIDPAVLASAGDNISDGWRTVVPFLREKPGAKVLIIGGGSIGLYAAAIAKCSGASEVLYADNDPDRLAIAEDLDLNVRDAQPGGKKIGSYDISVDASFSGEAALRSALLSTAAGGVTFCVFPGLNDVTIPSARMWQKGIRLFTSVAHCRSHVPQVLDLIQSHRLDPSIVTTERITWNEAERALAEPSTKPVVVRGPLHSGT